MNNLFIFKKISAFFNKDFKSVKKNAFYFKILWGI